MPIRDRGSQHVLGIRWQTETRTIALKTPRLPMSPNVPVQQGDSGRVGKSFLIRIQRTDRLHQFRVATELVLLVVCLGPIEGSVMDDLRRHGGFGSIRRSGESGSRLPGLRFGAWKKSWLILPLEGSAGGIVRGPKMIEQRRVRNLRRVVLNPYRLNVIADRVVGRVRGTPPRIPYTRAHHPVQRPKQRIRPPEAAQCERCLHGIIGRPPIQREGGSRRVRMGSRRCHETQTDQNDRAYQSASSKLRVTDRPLYSISIPSGTR